MYFKLNNDKTDFNMCNKNKAKAVAVTHITMGAALANTMILWQVAPMNLASHVNIT